jgi:hypothetical protein
LTKPYDDNALEDLLTKYTGKVIVDHIKFKPKCKTLVLSRSTRILGLQMGEFCQNSSKLIGAKTVDAFVVDFV